MNFQNMNSIPNNVAFLILLFFACIGGNLYAQGTNLHTQKERMESMRIAFYTREMNLSPQEATIFWPIFNRYKEEEASIRKNNRSQPLEDFKATIYEMSDEKAQVHLSEILDLHEKETALKRKYVQEIAKALSPKKALLMLSAEQKFKKELLRNIQEKISQQK
jgi:hypothetical protein